MIYDSLDIIPLKLYMRIAQSNNLSLLTDEKDKYKMDFLEPLWEKLRDAYNNLGISDGTKRIIDVTFRVEALKTKYDFVNAACNALNFEREEELEKDLRDMGYVLRATPADYMKDLEKIKREASNILVKARRLGQDIERKRPGQKDNKQHTIDTIIMGYMAATGVQYDTNQITVLQFDALKTVFEQKLDAMQKSNAKNKPAHKKIKK